MNGNTHADTNIGLPPPETASEISTKNKTRFRRHKRKPKQSKEQLSIPRPPRFTQTAERSTSFGDNSFDTDNAAYNLYAFVVRQSGRMNQIELNFPRFSVPLWSHWWRTLCCLCEKPYQPAMVLFQR